MTFPRRRLALFSYWLLLPLASTCALTPRKLDTRKSGANGLILRDKVFLERTSSKSGLILRFETTSDAMCELFLWSQDATVEPSKSAPKNIPCSGAQGQMAFAEVMSGLRGDILYSVRLVAWKSAAKTVRDELIINEGADVGEAKELVVARFNSPLRTAEIHRHRLGSTLTSEAMRKQLEPELGCKAGLDFKGFDYQKADPNVRVQNLMTRGFATSVANQHNAFPSYLRLNFNSLQSADQWEWLYTLDGRSYGFISQQAGQFQQVEVEGASATTLDDPQLTIADESIDAPAGKPVAIRWSAQNLAEVSYVLVQVGNHGQEGAFHCYFSSQIGNGTLTDDLLKNLTPGFYDLHITLVSTQLQMLPGQGLPPWLISSSDWRTTRLKRL